MQSKGSLARVHSIALVGIQARSVEVEIDLAVRGLPDFQIVGLPNAAVREARQRVKSAISSTEVEFPRHKITANLAPGDLRKEGSVFDLAIAIGILKALGVIQTSVHNDYLFIGELALDGRLRPVRGALAAALHARSEGFKGVIVPRANAPEASLVAEIKVVGADHLIETVAFLQGEMDCSVESLHLEKLLVGAPPDSLDLAEVRGQAMARRALEIAAAGDHNLLLIGPPGCGKTMLARRLPGILPPLTPSEAIEVTHIWSVAGLLDPGSPVVTQRPFRSPHHHASGPSIIGGGSPLPRPGEISLAHRGVLFMDEMPLFSLAVLEGLRQPLEEGVATVARMGATIKFPSRTTLVAAANPCYCAKTSCVCAPGRLDTYRARLSRPLLDRIDIQAEVARLSNEELFDLEPSEPSWSVRSRVLAARKRREERLAGGASTGLESLSPRTLDFFRSAYEGSANSARSFGGLLRVARTIADLHGSGDVEDDHLAEAMQFHRNLWGEL